MVIESKARSGSSSDFFFVLRPLLGGCADAERDEGEWFGLEPLELVLPMGEMEDGVEEVLILVIDSLSPSLSQTSILYSIPITHSGLSFYLE